MNVVMTRTRSRPAEGETKAAATRIVVSAFGAVAALAGVEHGIGEVVQGSTPPPSMVFESWPDTAGFEILSGEPAMTLVPNMMVTGVLAIIVALAMGVWAVRFIDRNHGGAILVGLAGLLLLVGGGFGPPVVAAIAGVAATRMGKEGTGKPSPIGTALARVWRWLLGRGVDRLSRVGAGNGVGEQGDRLRRSVRGVGADVHGIRRARPLAGRGPGARSAGGRGSERMSTACSVDATVPAVETT
jgi:hypothetical protein